MTESANKLFQLRGLVKILLLLPFIAACVSTGEKPPEKWEDTRRVAAHIDLGMNYLRRGELATAKDEFEFALGIDPRSDRASHGMALIETRQGQRAEARRWFARAVSLNKNNYNAVNDYAIHLCQAGEIENGLKQLKSIVDVRDNTAIIATNLGLGVCYLRGQKTELAKGYFRQALSAAPDLPQALLPMAEISKKENKHLLARAFLERYFATGALSPRALLLAVEVEVVLKDIDRAHIYARELRAQFPKSAEMPKLKALL